MLYGAGFSGIPSRFGSAAIKILKERLFMKRLITAIFTSTSQADNAVRELKSRGFSEDDMSVVSNSSGAGNDMYIGASYAAASNDDVTSGITAGNVITGTPGIFMGFGGESEDASLTASFFHDNSTNVRKIMSELGIASDIGKSLEKEVNKGKTLFYMEANENDIESVMEIMRANGAERPEIH